MRGPWRFSLTLIVALLAVWCGSYADAQERAKPRNRDRGHAQPQERVHRDDAQRRHPRPDGRYHWRNYSQRQRWDRDRFPRYYRNRHPFPRPYSYARAYSCGWYWVPMNRQLVYDPYFDREYWKYTDYWYVLRCFN